MAGTLNEIAYSIMNKVRPHLTDDSDLTIEVVKYDIGAERAKLLKQEIDRRYRITEDVISDLGCLELEIADAAECCNLSSDCTVLRTKKEIPSFLISRGKELITRIGPIVKTLPGFTIIPYTKVGKVGNGMFNKNNIFAYHMGNRVYVYSTNPSFQLLKYVNIRGILEDPTSIKDFMCDPSTDSSKCYSDDMPYKITKHLESDLKRLLVNFYLQELKLPKDLANDGTDKVTDNG